MAEDFGLVRKSMRPKLGHRSFFTPEGKVALMFLKMYTGLSCPKLMEQLNCNIHYQIFCDVIIDPTRPLTNYKLLDDIILELTRVRATAMEILYIFFGIHTANVVQLADRIEQRARLAAA